MDGCGGGARTVEPVAASEVLGPAWLQPPQASAVAPVDSAPPKEVFARSLANPSKKIFDPSTIRRVLEDERLAQAQVAQQKGKTLQAAKLLARALKNTKQLSLLDTMRWRYRLAGLYEDAGDSLAAVKLYDAASRKKWSLQDHARLRAAQLLTRLREHREALKRLGHIASPLREDYAVRVVEARALTGARRIDEATPIWQALLAERARGWPALALEFASALLNQPSVERARLAVGAARSVIYASPRGRGVGEARKLEKSALATLPQGGGSALTQPTQDERVRRARSLAAARQGRQALHLAEKILKSLKTSDATSLRCQAELARSKALGTLRRYAEASDAAKDAIRACQKHPEQVVALFLGGRYALRGGQPALARRRYADLEKRFPKHRFADDARLHRAESALALGDVAAFTRLLQSMGQDYPAGDMVEAGMFALARQQIEAGNWQGAVAPLQQSVRKFSGPQPYNVAGRSLYFLARARLALGQKKEGLELLEQVIRRYPLSYYMTLAYSRLASHSATRAERLLEKLKAREPRGDFVIADDPQLHRPAFLRAAELVRQGDGRSALKELDRLGVRKATVHPSLLWASAFLLARIDAPAASHGVLRSTTALWQGHYPEGVWRSIWEIAYPRPYLKIVRRELKRSPIPQHLAYGIMREESAFKPRVVSSAKAYGLMQIILPTAKMSGKRLGLKVTANSLKVPAVNIAIGCRFLDWLTRKFDYNPLLAIPGYNAGPGAPRRWVRKRPDEDFDVWVERIPYRETRHYTKRVIRTMAAYAWLYGKGMSDTMMRPPLKVQPLAAAPGVP